MIFTVASISGEYAILKDDIGEERFIAVALLPAGRDVGNRVLCENMTFTMLE